MSRLVNPDEETTDWRAVCGKSACTVRREGRRKPFLPPIRFILLKAKNRTTAILANDVIGVIECPEQEVITGKDMLPDIEHIDGAIKLKDGTIGMIITQDFDKFLSLDKALSPDTVIPENTDEKK